MNYLRLCISTPLLLIVAACGGAGGDNGTAPDNAAIDAVSPFVNAWELPRDWNGRPNDEAFLLIKAPNDQGVAEATIFDFDDPADGSGDNCYLIDGGEAGRGVLRQSLNNQIFLEVPAFTSAVVSLTPDNNMEITVFTEGATSSTEASKVLTATRQVLTESDFPLCS